MITSRKSVSDQVPGVGRLPHLAGAGKENHFPSDDFLIPEVLVNLAFFQQHDNIIRRFNFIVNNIMAHYNFKLVSLRRISTRPPSEKRQ